MRFFTWLRRHRATVNGILITVFTSLFFNAISDNHGNLFSEFRSIFTEIIDVHSLGGVLIVVSLFLLVVFNLVFVIVSWQLNKKSHSREFPDLMKRFTSPYEDEMKRKEYHPSTYLRLLLFFMHKNGYSKSERILLKRARELSKN